MKYLAFLICLALIPGSTGPAAAKGRKKKKKSLAQIAADEWKLEQAGNALKGNADPAARVKAIADMIAVGGPQVIVPLAYALLEDPAASVRTKAAQALATMRSPEAKGALTLATKADPDPAVRSAAKAALTKQSRRMSLAKLPPRKARFKGGRPTAKSIRAALKRPGAGGRLWAVNATIKTKFKGRLPLLRSHLQTDPSARVRVRAARAVVKIAGKRALPDLVKATSDRDPTVRFEVARALASYDDTGALKVLQALASSDPDAAVRQEVKDLLEPKTVIGKRLLRERIKRVRSPNPAQRVTAIRDLAKLTHWRAMTPMACALLADKSKTVRAAAAQATADLHDFSLLMALRAAAVVEQDPKQRKAIRSQLKALARKVSVLVKQLSDKDVAKRVLAARALGQATYPQGKAALIGAISDKEVRVRRAVARALTNFRGKDINKALRRMSSDSDARVRSTVDRHFRRLDKLRAWRLIYKKPNRLVTKVLDRSPLVRADAAIALGVAAAERASGSLIRLLTKDKVENVRLAAAWALVLMSSQDAEKALKYAAAKDKSQKVRLAARKYLVIEKVTVDDLISQLSSEQTSTRLDAAEAISLRASRKTLGHLARAATCDPSPAVRAAALRGLARIGNPFARSVIRSVMRRDSKRRVRAMARTMYVIAGG